MKSTLFTRKGSSKFKRPNYGPYYMVNKIYGPYNMDRFLPHFIARNVAYMNRIIWQKVVVYCWTSKVLYEEVAHFNPIQKAVYEMFKKLNDEGLINTKSLDAIRMAMTQVDTESIENNLVLAEIFEMLKEEIILDKLLSPLEVATMFKIISLDLEDLKSVAAYVEVLKGNLDFDAFALDGAVANVHQFMEMHHIYQNVMMFFFEEFFQNNHVVKIEIS